MRTVIALDTWLLFAGSVILMALSPGPNLYYLVSRTICQGVAAGLSSLLGVMTGMTLYALLAAFGLSAVFLAVPFLFEVLRWGGAAYLLWLAWRALSAPEVALPARAAARVESHPRLYLTGLATCLLNPKLMVLYVSLLPPFIVPARGSVLWQSAVFGATQVVLACSVHLGVVLCAGRIARLLANRPRWISLRRYVLASLLAAIAVKVAAARAAKA